MLHSVLTTKLKIVASLIVATTLLYGCKTTKYVPDGEYLLNRVKIEGDKGNVTHDDVMNYVKQRPNIRVLGFWRLNLDVYNLSRKKDNGFNNWLRRIGEAPVVYDSSLMNKSREQIQIYLKSRGYFNASVSDTMIIKSRKKCVVKYKIDSGNLYRISHMGYGITDKAIRDIVLSDTTHSLLRHGEPFDAEVHDEERVRLTKAINEEGFYQFDKNYIYFMADSSIQRHWISDSLILINRSADTIEIPHRKAIIDEVNFYVNRAYNSPIDNQTDSLEYKDYKVYYQNKLIFEPQLLANSCFIRKGEIYKQSNIESTLTRLNSLKLFGTANIRFIECEQTQIDEYQHLRCIISLTTSNIQSYAIELEGTNSSGNLGGAANIRYSHANLLHHAEVFNVKFRIASQNQFARDGKERFYTFETGIEASLSIPKFLAPFGNERFIKRHNPTTLITASYDYQRRPDFTKSVVASKLQYSWRQKKTIFYSFTPIEINIVNIPTISENFREYIKNTYLQYSYTDHFIMSLGVSALYNPSNKKTTNNAWYANFNIETAGNVLSLMTEKQERGDDFKKIWNIRYAQYVKTNIELRYLTSDIWRNKFAYRLYAGIGIPYGNSKMLPFEKSFFVGGANSIRAWPVRGLGPGSSKSDTQLRYHNQISDIRLEMNAEYRFRLVSVLEGAIFADAGNIWALSRSTDDTKAIISSDFYKQIALGSGLGIRFNFDYFILRIDAAIKLHDPSAEYGQRWVIAENSFKASDINYNFAIGYPF